MPPSKSGWPAASPSSGCASPTNAAARCCKRLFFPRGHFTQVPVEEVQRCLRRVFAEYGLPRMMRVDNGSPWGSWSDLPTALALWLIGLGIEMHWNTPRRPQENGVIERSQGLASAWAEPRQCQTVRQLQSRLNRADQLQREVYPSIRKQSRLAAYPELNHSGRRYSLRWEQQHWDWQRVLDHLSAYCVPRHVDQSGKIGLYHDKLFVGCLHKGRDVLLQFDPERLEWLVSDEQGNQLRTVPATSWTPHAVQHLEVPRSATLKKRRPVGKQLNTVAS